MSEDGRAVLYGFTESRTAEFGIADLIFTGAGRIEGFYLFRETEFESCAKGLARLSQLVDAELLNCHVNVIEDWAKVGTVAADLSQRRFAGKATLTI